jgi:hypothetical protein
MNTAVLDYCGSSVFAPAQRKSRATTAPTADTFARHERGDTAQPPLPVSFVSINGTVLMTKASSPKPIWLEAAIRSMNERWGSYEGWDSYDAKPTQISLAVKLLNYLSEIAPKNAPAPTITPLVDGGVQAEWHRRGKDLEVVVPAEESARFYFYDANTDREELGELTAAYYTKVNSLITEL